MASILEALDADVLQKHRCWFGGGTAITLMSGEYRESVDIDFLVSDVAGYRDLRQKLGGSDALRPITRNGRGLHLARPIRTDQYGVRTFVTTHDIEIKFEVVLEARIQLDVPSDTDRICGVATLTRKDMGASKLLANSDRWADDAVNSRDLIDLAMLQLDRHTLHAAIEKAAGAYGDSIVRDLSKAIEQLRKRPGRLVDCMDALQMRDVPPGVKRLSPAALWKLIRALDPKAPRTPASKRRSLP